MRTRRLVVHLSRCHLATLQAFVQKRPQLLRIFCGQDTSPVHRHNPRAGVALDVQLLFLFGVKHVQQIVLVELQHVRVHFHLILEASEPGEVEHVLDHSWQNALVVRRAQNGVRFPRASLSVREEADVEAVHAHLQQLLRLLVHLLLRGVPREHGVVLKLPQRGVAGGPAALRLQLDGELVRDVQSHLHVRAPARGARQLGRAHARAHTDVALQRAQLVHRLLPQNRLLLQLKPLQMRLFLQCFHFVMERRRLCNLRLHLLHLALGGGHVGLRLHQLHLQLLLLGDSVAQLPLHVSLLGRQLVRLLLRALRRRLGRRRLLALLRGGCGVGRLRGQLRLLGGRRRLHHLCLGVLIGRRQVVLQLGVGLQQRAHALRRLVHLLLGHGQRLTELRHLRLHRAHLRVGVRPR
mmetsp:Transcript_13283/g.25467  ORF Transcript_13283/g.25467 Transcript_13283/m.25467 type:complete len:408 (-) Transcript_13283:1305-2528(-)